MPERGVLWVFFQNHLRFGKQPPGSAPVLSRHYITARGSGKQEGRKNRYVRRARKLVYVVSLY
ncbi:hypothetical protein B2H99_12500 [Morganella morganii]|nr:hypothetical protein CO693_19385 [Morganella morganii]OPL22699.1 hypothetical protein B5S45_18225 [Morganella morganii]OQP26091.1 hypothetical protein B2H99_12500 [Morganella morganii]OQP30982.1 hypothetical protein B2I00_08025 [Morganella morganii]OVF56392.1 hypothetical protein B5724_06450 [Morganella morganii]